MSKLKDKLLKNSTIKYTSSLESSILFKTKDMIQTSVPMINVALSGDIEGGLTSGLTMVAGPSKHFKTGFSLLLLNAFLNKHKDGIVLFYDSEFGSPEDYFEAFDIDTSSIVHTPITNIEELKFDISQQLENITRTDKILIFIDSIGNLASKKEVDDALDGKSVADMTRAKQLKSLFRIVTPHLTLKDIPLIVVNHTYSEIGLFPRQIVGGGCVVEDTLIQTPTGLKAIQDFKEGDIVITKYGEQTVSHFWNPETLAEGTPECYDIEFADGYKVTCSAAHKFIIDGKWVEAKDLVAGMDVEVL